MWTRRTAKQKAGDVRYLATYYWHRLVATAGGWFFWDFSFYGNRVFQTTFVSILSGGSASFGCSWALHAIWCRQHVVTANLTQEILQHWFCLGGLAEPLPAPLPCFWVMCTFSFLRGQTTRIRSSFGNR